MVNQDKNGIRYGYTSANALDSEVVDALMYEHGKNLSYADAVLEETKRQREEWETECEAKAVAAQDAGTDCVLDDFEPDLEDFSPEIYEPIVEGTYEGVSYRSSWLGSCRPRSTPAIWPARNPPRRLDLRHKCCLPSKPLHRTKVENGNSNNLAGV